MPLDLITKLVNIYIILYNEMKYKNDEMIVDFTAENFIEVLKMKFDSEQGEQREQIETN